MKTVIMFVGFYGSIGIFVSLFVFTFYCGRERGRNEMFDAQQISLPYPKWYRKWVIENDKEDEARR